MSTGGYLILEGYESGYNYDEVTSSRSSDVGTAYSIYQEPVLNVFHLIVGGSLVLFGGFIGFLGGRLTIDAINR